MANYANLKATINANIKANGTEAITGPVLNSVLTAAVNTLGAGYQFMGVATTSTSPGTPDANVFYIAATPGTYTNFGGLTVADGEVAILKYNGSWTKEVTGAATAAQLTQLGQYVSNLEYIRAYTDADGRFLLGIKPDGSIEWAKGIPQPIKEVLQTLSGLVNELGYYITNPEYIRAYTDAEGKLIWGINKNGGIVFGAGIPPQIQNEITQRISAYLGDTFSYTTNPEFVDVKTDSNGSIIDGIRPNAEVVHFSKHKFVGGIDWTADNISELSRALRAGGFQGGAGDWSDDEFVELPKPRACAIINIISNALPTSKTDDFVGYLEYWDKDGNYFKKAIEAFNIQGDTSAIFYKKNYAFDVADGSSWKFGDWVAQDSFHLKKYYIDAFRGQTIVAYRLAEDVYQTHELGNRKPYEYLYHNDSITSSNGKFAKDFYSGALTHPDGFPVKLFHNGSLIGLYAFCLKKHRDNYAMKKSEAKNILLDGTLGAAQLWGGTIDWSAFEIRNPKGLIDINGDAYDGDNPTELSDSDSFSASVKGKLQRLADAMDTISAISDPAQARAKFEEYFKPDYLIDYFLIGQVINDFDGFQKNWIWGTWDGNIWMPTIYDKDSIFGSSAQGSCIRVEQMQSIYGLSSSLPTGKLYSLYQTEIEARYAELREKGIFSVNHIANLLQDWLTSCGYDNIKEDLEDTCPETPSYRDAKLNPGWKIVGNASNPSVSTYDPSTTYQVGDRCDYCNPDASRKWGLKFEATQEVTGVAPLSGFYENFPTEGGYYNSLQRVVNWLTQRIAILDNYFNYNF